VWATEAAKPHRSAKVCSGQLCYNTKGLGVTVILGVGEGEKTRLLNLSRPSRPKSTFLRQHVHCLEVPESIGVLRWRASESWE